MKTFELMNKIYKDDKATSKAIYLYRYILDRAGDNNYAYPTVQTICNDLSLCETTVRKHMKILIDLGYIEKVPRFKNGIQLSNYYYVL